MPPPTSTDDKQGTVIDGTARSADWREKQRAAERPHNPGSPEASSGVSASEFDSAAAKDFVSSLMIPASKLADETRQTPVSPEAPDAYMNSLLNGSQKRQATQELEVDASGSSAQGDELDRWFEEQATSVPLAPKGQKLSAGSACLDIETSAAAGVERARRVRALRLPRAHPRGTDQQRRGTTGRRQPSRRQRGNTSASKRLGHR
jgi:hypothetical protein